MWETAYPAVVRRLLRYSASRGEACKQVSFSDCLIKNYSIVPFVTDPIAEVLGIPK